MLVVNQNRYRNNKLVYTLFFIHISYSNLYCNSRLPDIFFYDTFTNIPILGGIYKFFTTKQRIPVTTLIGLFTSFIRNEIHYHKQYDIVDNIEPEAVEIAYEFIVNYISQMDNDIID